MQKALVEERFMFKLLQQIYDECRGGGGGNFNQNLVFKIMSGP